MSFGLVAFQARVAHAAPLTINVSPPSAPVGDIITISGVDATANSEVRLYVLDYLFFGSTVTNDSGGYSIDVVVPAVPLGTYSIMALDVVSGDTSSSSFGVEPRVLLTPTQGGYSDTVTVRGEGFNSDSNVTFWFDGSDVTPPGSFPRTDFMGSFSGNFSVPSRINGTYEFTADDWWGASASAFFDVVPNLLLWPTSGAASTLGYLQGYGFAADVNVTVSFGSVDITPYPWMTTWSDGSWSMPFFVPEVADGVYTVTAGDDTGLSATTLFVVPGPVLTLSPDRTSDSAVVTASGIGYQPSAPVLLYLESIMMTNFVDLIWRSPNLTAQSDGSFEYSFIVPVTNPGVYTVGAYSVTGPASTELVKLAEAPLVIVDDSPLGVAVNVGSLHFRGEMAEFYVQTSFGGKPVDAVITSAKLYWNGALKQDLTDAVGNVAAGLFRISYSVPGDALIGTYSLVVEASYTTALVEAFGTSSGSFLLSAGFTEQYAKLIDVQGKIATIVVPDLGVMKANLTAINARLVGVDGKVATIQSDLGTLTADADVINAKVTSIDGNVATISSDLGTVKSQMTDKPTDYTGAATLILSLVAAVGAMTSLLYVRKIKPPTPVTATTKPPETPPPAAATEETRETPRAGEKEEPATAIPQETRPPRPVPETQAPADEPTTKYEAPSEAPPTPETPQE